MTFAGMMQWSLPKNSSDTVKSISYSTRTISNGEDIRALDSAESITASAMRKSSVDGMQVVNGACHIHNFIWC